MTETPGFTDTVRIADTPETVAAGFAGRIGTLYGFTTPSVTNAEVIGHTEDYALSVGFDDREPTEKAWFDRGLVIFVDRPAGVTIRVGDNPPLTRDEHGDWVEQDRPKRRWWSGRREQS